MRAHHERTIRYCVRSRRAINAIIRSVSLLRAYRGVRSFMYYSPHYFLRCDSGKYYKYYKTLNVIAFFTNGEFILVIYIVLSCVLNILRQPRVQHRSFFIFRDVHKHAYAVISLLFA